MEDEAQIVMLEVEDGVDVETEVMFGFNVGEQAYVSLMSTETDENEERDIYLYRFFEDGSIEPIDNEEEYDAAAAEFNRLVEDWCRKADQSET